MKLYYMTGACSLASLIGLHESGIVFETASLDRKTRRTSDGLDFLTVNSKGYVPALRLDDGQVLTENVAVLLYIADRNPAARLAPAAGTLERYRLIEWLAFINSEIHKTYSPLFSPATSAAAREEKIAYLYKRYAPIEQRLSTHPFLVGDHFTGADAYLFTVTAWADRLKVDLSRFPGVIAFQKRVAARPAVQKALREEGLLH